MDLPLKLLEGLLLLGLVLGFAWWQLRSIRVDQDAAAAERRARAQAESGPPAQGEGPGAADGRDRPDPR